MESPMQDGYRCGAESTMTLLMLAGLCQSSHSSLPPSSQS